MSSIDAIQQMLLALRDQFLEELGERLDAIEGLLLELEREGIPPEAIQELFRRIHSIKGSGGTHGLYDLTTVCHRMEDLLTAQEGKAHFPPAAAQALLGCLDLLREVRRRAMAGEGSLPDLEARMEALRSTQAKRRPRALVVEDTRVFSGLCRTLLEEEGFEVRLHSDGYQALLPALREPFSLILTGAEVPGLGGLALIASVKLSSLVNAKTPCILLTANRGRRETQGTGLGPDHILLKDMHLLDHLRVLVPSLRKR